MLGRRRRLLSLEVGRLRFTNSLIKEGLGSR
jgi:hypothetical protein